MNKILGVIVSIAVLACILIAAVVYISPNIGTGTTIGGMTQSDQIVQRFELKEPFPSISNSAIVYKVNKPVVDQEYIKHYTDLFGLNSSESTSWTDKYGAIYIRWG